MKDIVTAAARIAKKRLGMLNLLIWLLIITYAPHKED